MKIEGHRQEHNNNTLVSTLHKAIRVPNEDKPTKYLH